MTEPDKPQQPPSDPPPPPPQYGAYPGAYPPPPPPPPPYGGYQPGYQAAPAAPKNGIGIAALVVAIIGLFTVYGGIVIGVVAIVLGFIGRGRAQRGEATNGGVAIAGIVLGLLGVVVSIVAIALTIWGFQQIGGSDLFDCLTRAGSDAAAQQRCEEEFTQKVEDQFSVSVTPTP